MGKHSKQRVVIATCARNGGTEICRVTRTLSVMSYGDIDLDPLWLRKWLGAWRQQAINSTNVDISSKVFNWEKFHNKSSWTLSLTFVRRLHFQNYNHISQETMS